MTETSETNSGTTSEPSTPSSSGSERSPARSLESLLNGGHDLDRQTQVDKHEGVKDYEDHLDDQAIDLRGKLRPRDNGADLPELQSKDSAAEDDILGGLDPATRSEVEALLKSLKGTSEDENGTGRRGEHEEAEGAAKRETDGHRGRHQGEDRRERPLGVGKDQRTVKMIAEDLDVDPAMFYEEMMVPLGDGTGRHVSLEKLRSGYLGTDADQVHKDRTEHEQRLAAFEVDKSEHETRTVRDRLEVSSMLKLLQDHLPEKAVTAARLASQRQLAEAAMTMLERFPAWRDPKVAAAWQRKAFVECLKPHGFSRADAQAITDHRLCGLIDEYLKLRDFAAKVRNPETVQRRPKKAGREISRSSPGKGTAAQQRLAAAKAPGASREAKTDAIVDLIYGDARPGR